MGCKTQPTNQPTHALEYQFDSAARRFERLDSVWNCLRGHALKRCGINRKIVVSQSWISIECYMPFVVKKCTIMDYSLIKNI